MAPDPSSFRAPRLSQAEIRQHADRFREKYSKGSLPVEIEEIVEFDLNLNLQPIKGLKSSGDVEALLLGTRDMIVVDEDQFMDDRYHNRIRFSIAHEVGHYVLHSDIINSVRPNSTDDWLAFYEEIDEREYYVVERQADEFAGRLLVPPDVLRLEVESNRGLVQEVRESAADLPEEYIKDYVSSRICKTFGVSAKVVRIRIDREDFGRLLFN